MDSVHMTSVWDPVREQYVPAVVPIIDIPKNLQGDDMLTRGEKGVARIETLVQALAALVGLNVLLALVLLLVIAT